LGTEDLNDGDTCVVRRLGFDQPLEFRGIIRGVYSCDINESPDCYIVEMVDKIPNQKFNFHVITRACVDKE
jgi:hypothetical protein